MSATRLNNASFQASPNNQQRLPIVLRLLAQGSVADLLIMCGLSRSLGEEGRLPLPGPPEQLQAASALALKRSKFARAVALALEQLDLV